MLPLLLRYLDDSASDRFPCQSSADGIPSTFKRTSTGNTPLAPRNYIVRGFASKSCWYEQHMNDMMSEKEGAGSTDFNLGSGYIVETRGEAEFSRLLFRLIHLSILPSSINFSNSKWVRRYLKRRAEPGQQQIRRRSQAERTDMEPARRSQEDCQQKD